MLEVQDERQLRWLIKPLHGEASRGWSKHPVDGPAAENDEGADRPERHAAGAGGAATKGGGQKSGARTLSKGPF